MRLATSTASMRYRMSKASVMEHVKYSHWSWAAFTLLVSHLLQAVHIMELALQRYGSYEKFEQVTGGNLLTKSRIWHNVKKYMEKEGCMGEVREQKNTMFVAVAEHIILVMTDCCARYDTDCSGQLLQSVSW